ncbi:MAG TPA: SDR family oxidoreductase, partial [Cytophagales bacterium]
VILDELLEYYNQILGQASPVLLPENTVHTFCKALAGKKAGPLLPPAGRREAVRLPATPLAAAGAARVCSLALPPAVSDALKCLDEQKGGLTLTGLLFSAFGKAVLEEFGLPEVTIDVEFHGRPQQKELPDLSRSVAWWATTVPVHLPLHQADPGACSTLLRATAEYANHVNAGGGGARHFSERPDIRFNYLGHFPEQFGNGGIRMRPSPFNPGPTRSKNAQQEYRLFFTARYIGGQVVADIQYHTAKVAPGSIDSLAERFFGQLTSFLRREQYDCGPARMARLDSNLPSVGQPLHRPEFSHALAQAAGRRNVFVTGATGFLGVHLVKELLRDRDVHVSCLVRGESRHEAEARFEACFRHYFNALPAESRRRIRVITGDLLLPDFGMSPRAYAALADEADLVVHAAADINLIREYGELVPINIGATKKIVDFARTGKRKEVHYVSTLAVSGYAAGERHSRFTEDDFECGQLFVSAYEKTKFEAEKIVRDFLAAGGNGRIYRSSHIAADSVSSRFQRNTGQNRIFQMLKGMLLLKQIPRNYAETVSFSYVDVVARGMAHACLGVLGGGSACLHLENAQSVSFVNMAGMLKEMGYDVEPVDLTT